MSPHPLSRPFRFHRALVLLLAGLLACGAAAAQATVHHAAWLAADGEQARIAVRLLRDAATHGLEPDRYHADELAHRLERLDGADGAAFARDLDTAMTTLLADLHDGRIPPAYRAPAAQASRFDAPAYLASALAERRLEQAVAGAAPRIPLYDRVRATLKQYRELAARHPEWPPLPAVPRGGVAAGDRYEGAAQLAGRLRLLGDLDTAAGADAVYTPVLAAAVRRFQSRHGLAEDGVLGAGTLAALAVPPAHRVAQLELTLERLRWLPPLPQGRVVAVNVPAFRLWAFDTRHDPPAPVLEMRVIVGTAGRTQTPLFIGQMRYLEFNPYWNVPRSIEAGEIVPKLARNPSYLKANDMEVVSPSGAVLPEADALAALRAGRARIRQRPGPANVLGAVKFAMPNPMNIYLHSTSAKELFNRTRRDLSHGCIRVEHAAELAQFVLADDEDWGADGVAATIAAGRTRTVTLPAPVPVILFYATAVTDRDGRALFADDIYRRDAPLIQLLHAR